MKEKMLTKLERDRAVGQVGFYSSTVIFLAVKVNNHLKKDVLSLSIPNYDVHTSC